MTRWLVFASFALISCLPFIVCSPLSENEAISDELAFQYTLFPYPPRPVVNLAEIQANIKNCNENPDSCTAEQKARFQRDLDNYDTDQEAVLKRDESLATVLDWLPGIVHHGFGGGMDVAKSELRVLIAGGGTGDATLYIARQLAIISPQSVVLHLDVSLPAVEIAKQRAANMNLTNIKFVHGSLFDITLENVGSFHYINCAGVLNLFPHPETALRVLRKVLHKDGVMGLMIYGELGRTGLYEIRRMMQMLREAPTQEEAAAEANMQEVEIGTLTSKGVLFDTVNRKQRREAAESKLSEAEQAKKKSERLAHEIGLLRELFNALPATARVKQSEKFFTQIVSEVASDGGAADMFLGAYDKAYTVPEIYDMVENAGLSVITFTPPAQYDPVAILGLTAHPELRQKVATLSTKDKAIFAELLTGAMHQHSLYATHKSNIEKPSPLHPALPPHKALHKQLVPCFSPFFSPARYEAKTLKFNATSMPQLANVTETLMLVSYKANPWFVGSPNHTISWVVSDLVVDESIYGNCKLSLGDIYYKFVSQAAQKEGRTVADQETFEKTADAEATSAKDADGNPTWRWFVSQIQPIYSMWAEANDVALNYSPWLW